MTAEHIAIATVTAPLLGFFVAFFCLRRVPRAAIGIVLMSGVVSMAGSAWLLYRGAHALYAYRWFDIGHHSLQFGILLDGKTLIMGAVVGLITLCIQIYSLGYMARDPGRGRFFAFLALFEWAMITFVYAANLLQTFVCWELVGLASFLLIGFWYHKPTAVAAAKKAFLMTRIGDVGLFIGLILLYQYGGTLDIVTINSMFAADSGPPVAIQAHTELIAGLLFVGIVGKSAQFPLHTWLPDAMEGPTPVSALLHSATMVAAGVFLFARFHELFLAAPHTTTVVLAIATFTAILASTMAMVAKDMKKVLAYSSISQLGFMLMGLAAGSLFAGFFHLTTHAFFKALLFMCAGAYIHHFGTNDLIAMGRAGARKMRVTTVCLCVAGAALAGIPPLAGFFSKEQVIGALGSAGHTVFLIGAYFAALLTAYYTFRMIFLLTRPNPGSRATEDEPAYSQHGAHAHSDHGASAPATMKLPMVIVAFGAVGLGFFGDTIGRLLHISVHHPAIADMAPAVGIALAGVCLAWFEFGAGSASQTGFIAKMPAIERLFRNRWYVDALYRKTFVRLAHAIAGVLYGTETKGLDGGTDQLAHATYLTGNAVANGQTGRLQIYLGTAVIVMAAVGFYVGMR